MTENEKTIKQAIRCVVGACDETCYRWSSGVCHGYEEVAKGLEKALEENQQYRTYKEIFENHFDEKVLKLFSNREEFGAWLERGKWIAKRCDEINKELEQYRAIGTVEEFNALKEKNVAKKPIGEYTQCKCSVCGRRVRSGRGSSSFVRDNFCQRCGQKLDWQ